MIRERNAETMTERNSLAHKCLLIINMGNVEITAALINSGIINLRQHKPVNQIEFSFFLLMTIIEMAEKMVISNDKVLTRFI